MRLTVAAPFVIACAMVVGALGAVSAEATPCEGGECAPVLGDLTFPNSGADEAQPSFIRGLLLLHNFEYADARTAFQEAQSIDRDFAMAYWGEALTHHHPLWLEKDSAAARQALAKLAPTREAREAKAGTPRERAYLAMVEDLFAATEAAEDTSRRNLAYERALREIYELEEAERARGVDIGVEGAALYGLAILASQGGDRDVRAYMRAAAVLEAAYETNGDHPGVVHYLIHVYDDPTHAPLGQRAAEKYAQLAAAAPHAKHMPSHIWQPLGRWADVVDSNCEAWVASEDRVTTGGLGADDRDWHALRFLQYGYLQQGRFEEARHILDVVLDAAAANPSAKLRWHAFRMRAAFMIEAETWDVPPIELPTDQVEAAAVVGDMFATGLGQLKLGNRDGARTTLQQMRDARGAEAATSKSAQIALLMEQQLEGMIALSEGQADRGQQLLMTAATGADRLSFDYGPPNPIRPAYELLGEAQLQLGDAAAALASFREALERDPRRGLALRGLAEAALQAGHDATAQDAVDDLTAIKTTAASPCNLP